jgi:hypothetical protein
MPYTMLTYASGCGSRRKAARLRCHFKLHATLGAEFVIQKLVDEALEIDSVFRTTNLELNHDVNDDR